MHMKWHKQTPATRDDITWYFVAPYLSSNFGACFSNAFLLNSSALSPCTDFYKIFWSLSQGSATFLIKRHLAFTSEEPNHAQVISSYRTECFPTADKFFCQSKFLLNCSWHNYIGKFCSAVTINSQDTSLRVLQSWACACWDKRERCWCCPNIKPKWTVLFRSRTHL